MQRSKKIYLNLAAILLLIAVLFGAVYAWFYVGDQVSGMKYSIMKINSMVSLYAAVDGNFNGIPDLLTANTQAPYYMEKYQFNLLDKDKYALSEALAESLFTPITLDNVIPTKVYTFKYELINKSSVRNLISFKLEAGAVDNGALLSVLSLQAGHVTSTGPDAEGTVSFGDKVYLADFVSGNAISNTVVITAAKEDVFVQGLKRAADEINCKDFWLQIQMEPYETLKTRNPDFAMTQEQYNALQNQTATLSQLGIYFEVVDGLNDVTAAP